MRTKIVEASNGFNWGKFMLARFDSEWRQRSAVSDSSLPLLHELGWGPEHLWVLDLQTGEGACFRVGGNAAHDLNNKHRIWVCPLFEPFLQWLYQQDVTDLERLPSVVELPLAEAAIWGYRREGKPEE